MLEMTTLRRFKVIAVLFAVAISWRYLCYYPSNPLPLCQRENRITTPASHPYSERHDHFTLRAGGPANSSLIVDANGDLLQRVRQLNTALDLVRRRLIAQHSSATLTRDVGEMCIVWGIDDDHVEQLTARGTVTTLSLPWTGSHSGSVWNSLIDTENILVHHYYPWTADDQFCRWIETPNTTMRHYDVIYKRHCSRDVVAATRTQPLPPLFLNMKRIGPLHGTLGAGRYWPNDGQSYPPRFYTHPPTFTLHIHVHREAIVTRVGDVFSGNTKLVLDACIDDMSSPLALPPQDELPWYKEVFNVGHTYGYEVYHRMVEVVGRLAPYVDFLRANPQVYILASETDPHGRLAELLAVIGVEDAGRRLLVGPVRADVVYQPRSAPCHYGHAVENQLVNRLYTDYIRRTFAYKLPQRRDRLVVIRRTNGTRQLVEQRDMEVEMQRVAADFNLTYVLFSDNPTPLLNETMIMFHSALLVVGPHGAALSNLLFAQPDTMIVEATCNPPHVNMCFQLLSVQLGMRWHGLGSPSGCVESIQVWAATIRDAVRMMLQLRLHQLGV